MKGVFEVVVQISDRAPGWHSLRLLTAELARRVGERDRAAGLFEEIVAAQQKSPDDRQLSELVAKADVVKTLEGLRKELSASAAPADLVKRIAGDIEYALEFYRRFFGISVATPPVRIDNSFVNTYFDGSSYVAHPVAAETPDVTYHEMFHAILGPLGLKPKFQGQPGALIESLADVFASVVKQKRLSQTAQTADWVLGKGFLASLAPGMENAPIRSLKAPGTAYKDNPRLGSDPQPDNMSGYKRISDDNGGIHIYCGIPNKAFYNAAMALGTEDAAQIWRMAIEGLKADANFDDFAARTAASAGKLLGAEKAAQVKSAWQKVGLLVDKTARRVPDAPEDAVHGGLRREARRQ
ncbi:MAG: M4 family metallopeptidase [Acidobacteriia bacterium]|nr:M4 family metallopeptidase [Terriglobia bacterium]